MAVKILAGDCREVLKTVPDESVNCCVTSPPYWGLRDYGHAAQIGQEPTPDAYVEGLVQVFREIRRVLQKDGSLWLNLGDSYAAQRGGTLMPAETLAGGKGGKGDDSAHRGRSTKELGGRQDESSPEARTGPVAHRNARAFGLKHKDLVGIPWRVAFALQADGWWLREDIIWAKPNCMPESVTDRCTRSHEYIFHLTKAANYYHDADAIKEPAIYADPRAADGFVPKSVNGKHAESTQNGEGRVADKQRGHSRRHDGFNDRWGQMDKEEQCSGMRNKRSVWTVAPAQYRQAHFATFPPALIRPCILAGCPVGGTVLDPFGGSGTTGEVSEQEGRNSILIELNPEYVRLADKRTEQMGLFT